jgi:hypothetical protein
MRKRFRNRHWPKVLLAVLVLLALAAFIGCRIVGGIFKSRLAAMVQSQFGAQLETGAVIYRPPFSFIARDVRVYRQEPGGTTVELLRVAGLNLRLGGFPHQGEPLAVERLVLDRPVVRIVAAAPTPSTTIGVGAVPARADPSLARPAAPLPPAPMSQVAETTSRPAASRKVRISSVEILDGQILFPRRDGGSDPIRLSHLQISILQKTPGTYGYRAAIRGEASIAGEASGFLNVDSGTLQVEKLALAARATSLAALFPWSAQAKQEIASASPDGMFTVAGNLSLALKDIRRANYRLTLGLEDGAARVGEWKRSLREGSARIVLHNGAASEDPAVWSPVQAVIQSAKVAAGTARLNLSGGELTLMPQDGTWRLAKLVGRLEMGKELPISLERTGWFFEKADFRGPVEFTAAGSGPWRLPPGKPAIEVWRHEVLAYPHGLSVKPRSFALPVESISGGPIALRGGVVTLQNLIGTFGGDKLLLRTARLTLEDAVRHIRLDDLRTQVKFEEIAGTMIFHQPSPAYPGPLGKVIDQLRPDGSFVVGGGSWYANNRYAGRKLKPDFFIRLIADGGSFRISDYQVPLTAMQGQATIAPMTVDIARFDARALGGTVWAAGQIVPGRPFLYQGRAQVRNIDLAQMARALSLGEPAQSRLSGKGYADLSLSGTGSGGKQTAAETFTSDGEFEILRGNFWSVPTVHEVASQVKHSEELGDGDAAGIAHVAHQVLSLKNVALNSPMLGLQGSGTIGFDKSLDMTVVAAPLGDWRDKMRQAGIPVVGDVLGSIQHLLNTAQGALLYQFRVTGTVTHPIKAVIPAPVITQPIAALFGQMLRNDQKDQLLNGVKGAGSKPSPAAPPAPGAQPAAGHQHAR